jgi:RNA polymerase sigma-70 factor (ECF subfamily)
MLGGVSDEETRLMLRVAAGDAAAFEALVVRVLPRLLGFFRRLGADRTEAEDLAQEVLFKIYRVRERYEARARFITYLFHVARNHWIDLYRHRKVQPGSVSADAPTGGEDGGGLVQDLAGRPEAPDQTATREELAAALARAVEALGEEHREVFVLSQVEGLRYQDIGAILDIPVGTVKSRMHAAFRQLREALSREGFEP